MSAYTEGRSAPIIPLSRNSGASSTEPRQASDVGQCLEEETRNKLIARVYDLEGKLSKISAELAQYRRARATVLRREREAQTAISENDRIKKRVDELDARNRALADSLAAEKTRSERFEQYAKGYQAELQNALTRLHWREAKFNELSKECEALRLGHKNVNDETKRLERLLQERFEWRLGIEREKVHLAYEKRISREQRELQDTIKENRLCIADLQKKLEEEKQRSQEKITQIKVEADRELQRERDFSSKALTDLRERLSAAESELAITKRARQEKCDQLMRRLSESEEKVLELNAKLVRKEEQNREESARNLSDLRTAIEDKKCSSSSWGSMPETPTVKRPPPGFNNQEAREAWAEAKAFEAAYIAETEKVKNLEAALISETRKSEQMAAALQAEIERLKSVYPLHDLLAIKDEEVQRAYMELASQPKGSPGRKAIEQALAQLMAQRDKLCSMLMEHEKRIEAQAARIRSVTYENKEI